MKKQLNCISEMIDLTVKGVTLSGNSHVISFKDDSYIIIAAGEDFDGEIMTKVDRYPAEPSFMLVHACVYTKKEFNEYNEKRRKRNLKEMDERDRELYESLKMRYENEKATE